MCLYQLFSSARLSYANELLRGIKRYLEAPLDRHPGPTPIETPASLGLTTKLELTENKLFQQLNEVPGQPSVLDQTQLGQLSTVSDEHQVIAFLTPFLEETLGQDSDIRVVNSEECPWLVTSSQSSRFNQKPDNIFCTNAIYSARAAFYTVDPVLVGLRRPTDKFGVLTDWRLRDCIDATGEGKVKIDNQAFGEVINYARHICYQGGPERTKLLLYDKTEFWLVSALRGAISLVQTCGWAVPGSRQILRDYIHLGRSPWIKLLIDACTHWQLTVSNDSFLGMGTFGRVFKVSKRDEGGGHTKFMALKLVLPGRQGEQPLELDIERASLVRTAQVVPDVVAHVEDFNNFGDNGAALLLRDIGGKAPQRARHKVFEALGLLHENDIVHGDPRLDNAIYVQESVRWIDFRTSAVFLNPADIKLKQRDMTILARSCYGEMTLSVLEQVIQQYNGTKASARGIFDALTVQHQQAALT